jgi:hypothetical protein
MDAEFWFGVRRGLVVLPLLGSLLMVLSVHLLLGLSATLFVGLIASLLALARG